VESKDAPPAPSRIASPGSGSCTARILPSILIPRSFSKLRQQIRPRAAPAPELPAPTFEERCPPASPPLTKHHVSARFAPQPQIRFSLFAPMVVTSFLTTNSRVVGSITAVTAPPAFSAGVNVRVTVLSFTTIAEIAAPYSPHHGRRFPRPSG